MAKIIGSLTDTNVIPATDDKVVVLDTSDSDNPKVITVQSIVDLSGGGGGGGSISDGDKGDITVTSSGLQWTIDKTAVTDKTEDTTPDTTNDYTFSYDASADSIKKIKLSSIYNDENAQDAVGNILTDSNDIDFTYDDATPSITASLTTPSSVTPATDDKILLKDTSNSNLLRIATGIEVAGLITGGKKITVSTSAPSSPAVGDVWIDTN